MKKWNDFFNEEPPAGHDDKVRRAVTSELEHNRSQAVRSWRELLFNWKALSAAAGGLAVVLLASRQQNATRDEESEWAWFQTMLGSDDVMANVEDLAFAASGDFDLEMMEDLDVLEEMEGV